MFPKEIIKALCKRAGVEVKRIPSGKDILRNVYGSTSRKRALLSYITSPYLEPESLGHTNRIECRAAGDILHELGYQVDVVDFYADSSIRYEDYEVIYGMGRNLEKSFACSKPMRRIYYATGACTIFSNMETLRKSRAFHGRSGMFALGSVRYTAMSQDAQHLLSDRVIVLGNAFTKGTYLRFDADDSRYSNLDAFFYRTYTPDIKGKDFGEARRHFIWFGSSGLLHKGLDTAIDVFLRRRDLFLHICGANKGEAEFFKFYGPLIAGAGNITDHGFIDIQSEEFRRLMDTCAFAIYPSVSEGGAPALLTVMGNGGLIPLACESVGLDMHPEIGYVRANDSGGYLEAIEKLSSMDDEELRTLSGQIMRDTCRRYTIGNYRKSLKVIIKNSLNES